MNQAMTNRDGKNIVHQSARSSCPVMLVPLDRKTWNRAAWKWLWRANRVFWRAQGEKIVHKTVEDVFGRLK
jgi:hypothetical protein